MAQSNQPAFWLVVKKEYVTQNFDDLFKYIKAYRYIKEEETPDSDFNKTFQCLKEVAYDYLEQTKECSLAKKPSDILKDDIAFAVKLIATYILASKEKKNIDDHRAIIALANMLLLEDQVKLANLKEKIKTLIINCICRRSIKKTNFSWQNLETIMNLEMMASFLGNIEFEDTDAICKHEGKGIVIIDKSGIHVAPMNDSSYRLLTNPHTLHLDYGIDIKSDTKTNYSNFGKLHDMLEAMNEKQETVKPAVGRKVQEEDNNSFLMVRVTKKFANVIHASTLPESKVQKSGRVEIAVKKNYGLNGFWESNLEEGDYLKVKSTGKNNFVFSLNESFEEFYKDYLHEKDRTTCKAVFVGSYSEGWQFLSEYGFLVNVPTDEEWESDIYNYKYENFFELNIYKINTDNKGNLIACGEIYDMVDEIDRSFATNAKKTIIEAFKDSCKQEKADNEPVVNDIDTEEINCLARSIFQLATTVQHTEEKYIMMHAARMMFNLAGNDHEKEHVKFQMRYIHCLAKFAQGEDPKEIKLRHDEGMETTPLMEEQIGIIQMLNKYKMRSNVTNTTAYIHDKEELENLIDASNILIGKINNQEIERIKKKIATDLGVSDIYVNSDNIDNYGEESDILEFKTSFVYPPNNNMAPDLRTQQFNVLKAVCGMLNGDNGGEILLGVDDDGFDRGLQNDITYLYDNKLIEVATLDKLRLFISAKIDHAFTNKDQSEENKQITATRVKTNIEKGKNGNDIIRITIAPYEYGIVFFHDTDDMPDYVKASAFFRKGGETVKLDESSWKNIHDKKLRKIDPDIKKFKEILRAKQDKRVVILKNYISSSSNKKQDRKVEAYQPIESRKSVICYDIEKQQLLEFKTTRFEDVQITEERWTHEKRHKSLSIDVFDMLQGTDPAIKIKLKLTARAYNLLLEEYGKARDYIKTNQEDDAEEYPFILKTEIYSLKGIGRFYIGLAKEIKIVQAPELKKYAQDYIKESGILE